MHAHIGQSDRVGLLTCVPDVGNEVGEMLKYAANTRHTDKQSHADLFPLLLIFGCLGAIVKHTI